MTTFNRMQKLAGIVTENQIDSNEDDYNEELDLFNNWEDIPEDVAQVLAKYEEEDNTYESLTAMAAELEPLGYTFDSYLDAVPYNLRKIN